MPDVETFHHHPRGGTFPRRAVSDRTFPRRVFHGDVETFLIRALCPVQKYARRGNVFRALANVSTSVSFLNVSTSDPRGVVGRAAGPRDRQRGNVFPIISEPKKRFHVSKNTLFLIRFHMEIGPTWKRLPKKRFHVDRIRPPVKRFGENAAT